MDDDCAAFFAMPQRDFGAQAGAQASFQFGHFGRRGLLRNRWGFLAPQSFHKFLGLTDVELASFHCPQGRVLRLVCGQAQQSARVSLAQAEFTLLRLLDIPVSFTGMGVAFYQRLFDRSRKLEQAQGVADSRAAFSHS